MRRTLALIPLAAALGCPAEDPPPDFTVRPGVEVVSVLDATPGAELSLYDQDDTLLVTLVADDFGQAHFAYIPDVPTTLETGGGLTIPLVEGGVLKPGEGYAIYDESTDPPLWSGRFDVLAVGDVPPTDLYERQFLQAERTELLTESAAPEQGYHYLEMRDGTLLSAKVRFPDPNFYGDGPYPTVIEYSGYAPSRPDRLGAGQLIANALGYATVGVNMRGTGCSGGVFDVFNRAQHADGYDIVEIVARQDWALHGHVGMVGLSYPGISQLFVASTAPPSLAAVVPLSVIADPWAMQWPGGVYNSGFTAQWLGQRDEEAGAGGLDWVDERIAAGDAVCEANLKLSEQNIDFGPFLHNMEFRPRDAGDRDLNVLVEQITAPAFVAGGWQDEQTGANFGAMLDRFERSPSSRFLVYNGRHVDGFAPDAVARWHEFLEFYVARRVPRLPPVIRGFAAGELAGPFGFQEFEFGENRFAEFGDDYAAALAAYEAEPRVRVLFEAGAGGDVDGTPVPRFETTYDAWPPAGVERRQWFPVEDGALAEAAGPGGADLWEFDAEAGSTTFFGASGYQIMRPIWESDWTVYPEGKSASYVSAAFTEDTVLAGPGVASLWLRSPVDDLTVQVTLTEIRADGGEVLIQSGHLRVGHRAGTRGADDRLVRDFSVEAFEPAPVDTWFQADVQLPSFAHPMRPGSALRMTIGTPGRNHGLWEFEAPTYAGTPTFALGRGGDHPTTLSLAILDGIDVAPGLPPCPSLRGQPCRTYEPSVNVAE